MPTEVTSVSVQAMANKGRSAHCMRQRFVPYPGRQQKAAFALLAAEQRCLAPGGTDQIGAQSQSGFCRQQAAGAAQDQCAQEKPVCLGRT